MIQDAKQKDKKYKIIKGFGSVDCVQSDRYNDMRNTLPQAGS